MWLGLALPLVGAFCWLVVASKVSTVNNIKRRGLMSNNISFTCVMCRRDGESVDQLFLHCKVAVSIWSSFIERCGVAWCCPKNATVVAES